MGLNFWCQILCFLNCHEGYNQQINYFLCHRFLKRQMRKKCLFSWTCLGLSHTYANSIDHNFCVEVLITKNPTDTQLPIFIMLMFVKLRGLFYFIFNSSYQEEIIRVLFF